MLTRHPGHDTTRWGGNEVQQSNNGLRAIGGDADKSLCLLPLKRHEVLQWGAHEGVDDARNSGQGKGGTRGK